MTQALLEELNGESQCCGFKAQTKAHRRYNEWKGNNMFLCGGRLILGVHVSHLNTSLLLILFSWAEYTFLVIPFLNDPRLYLLTLAGGTVNVALLFCTAFVDPGILPRQHFQHGANSIRKEAAILKSNFCRICNIWRPYRARHCKYCDNCVDIFDHHCPWTGTCIGIRNYPQFLLFIISVWLGAIVVLMSAIYILLSWVVAGAVTDRYFLRILALVVTIPWTFVVLFAVGSLLSFHLFLIFRGQTTNEYFRERRARQLPPSSPSSPVDRIAALSPSEAAAQRLMDNNADTVEVMIAPTGSARCLKMILWKAGKVTTSAGSNSDGSTVNPTDNSSNVATIGSNHTPHNSVALEGLQLPPAGSHSRSAAELKGYYDSTQAVDQVLTPLYDVDSTPFPQLSPSPQSPRRLKRKDSTQYTSLRLDLDEPPNSTALSTRNIDNISAISSPVSNTGSPLSISPIDKDGFESLSPENTLLLEQMRANLAQHRRNLTVGIGSGAHSQEPSTTLIFPPPLPNDHASALELTSSNTRGYVSRRSNLEMTQGRSEPHSVTTTNMRSLAGTIACLPCGAVACTLRLCGCWQPSPASAAKGHDYRGHTVVPHSPNSPRQLKNVRYTYHYICCVVPIIPRSKLLPLWRRVDEQDEEQQQYLLEVLLDKIREAQHWGEEMYNDHSV